MANDMHPGGEFHEELAALRKRVQELQQANELQRRELEAARQERDHYCQLFERAPLGYQSLDAEGRLIEASPAYLQMLGFERDEVIGKWFGDLVVPEQAELFRERFPRFKAAGKTSNVEFDMLRKDGSRISVIVNGRVGYEEDGSFKQTHCLFHDVTEQKRGETALRREQERAQTYLDIAGTMILALDAEGKISLINQKGCEILGMSEGEVLGMDWFTSFLPPDQSDDARVTYDTLMRGEIEGVAYYENDIISAGGERRTIAWHNVPLTDGTGRTIGTLASASDITEQRRAENALRASEERFRQIAEALPDVIWMVAPNLDEVIYVSPAYESVFGQSVERFHKNPSGWLDTIHPEDREHVRDLANDHRSKEDPGGHVEREYRVLRSDGSARWIRSREFGILDSRGEVSRLCGIASDITERKEAEQQLRESEERYRLMMVNSPDMTIVQGTDGVASYISPQAKDVIGHSAERFVGIGFPDIIHPDDLERVGKVYNEVVGGGEAIRVEYRVIDGEGGVRWVSHTARHVRTGGESSGIQSTVRNITDMKRAEADLRESQQRYRQLFNGGSDAVFVHGVRPDGTPEHFSEVNDVACEMLGMSREKLLELSPLDVMGNDSLPDAVGKMQALQEKRSVIVERELKTADGRRLPTEINAHYFELAGSPTVLSIARDISERNVATDALAKSEHQYRSLFENMQNGFAYHRIVTDDDGRPIDYVFLEMNDAFQELTGLQRDQVLGKCVTEVIPGIGDDEFDWIGVYGRVAQTGYVASFERLFLPFDRWYSVSAYSPLKGHFAVVFEDITERKSMERELIETSNREQQRIGQDLHDGVGQEVTGIACLARALAGRLKKASRDEAVAAARIAEGVETIGGRLHEISYDLNPIHLEAGGLVSAIEDLAVRIESMHGIVCDATCDESVQIVDPAAAIQIYRILQECTNNAIRHGKASSIEIRLSQRSDSVLLSVKDNGCGIPEDVEAHKGMGLRSLRFRAAMLGGTFSIAQREPTGTIVSCSFPLGNERKDRDVADER